MPNILRIARKWLMCYNYTKINHRLADLLENNGFQVDMDPARHILLKLVIGSYKVKAVTWDKQAVGGIADNGYRPKSRNGV